MVELGETSSPSNPPVQGRPVVVRVKRKASQGKLDAFWLEINERTHKRPLLDLEGLSISDSAGKVIEELRTKKLLVQHVETISHSEATTNVLQSFMPDSKGSKDFRRKIEERKSTHKQDKQKQDQLRSIAIQKHEDLVRSARFEQIWKSRRGGKEAGDYLLGELCHLYDVVRVDTENKKSEKVQEQEDASVEDNAIMCNYLPLLRECLPDVAEDIESKMNSYLSKEDKYVYDLYTVGDVLDACEEDASTEYPLVQVNDYEDDYYDGPLQSEYGTDDSNAEDNPANDYPDEESYEDDKNGKDSDEFEHSNSEGIDVDEDDNEDWRWGYR